MKTYTSCSTDRRVVLAVVLAVPLVVASTASADVCLGTVLKPYTVSVSPDYIVKPILSVGESVPRTSNPAENYQFIGIPDGMGMHRLNSTQAVVYMNHELGQGTLTRPLISINVTNRGAFVSRWVICRDGGVASGDLAYNVVVDEANNLTLPVPTTANTTRGFARFCGGSLSWTNAGFDRPIYFCGEESGGAGTFDGLGGLGVCIFDNELHTQPWIGRFAWENTVAMPKPGPTTVLMGNEDGSALDSQLYMWVGRKDPAATTVMEKNGLHRNNGVGPGGVVGPGHGLYVLVPDNPGQSNEVVFQNGTINVRWVEIPNAEALTDTQLEAATDAVGGFGFVRVEDGDFDKNNPNIFYFVTTGGSSGNQLGRLNRLDFNPADPTAPCTLTVVYNADQVIAGGDDIAVSPDNMETTKDYIMLQEDAAGQGGSVMRAKGRDASIWRLEIKNNYNATRIAEANPPGTVLGGSGFPATFSTANNTGAWETSGIMEATSIFGPDSYLFDLQAHGPAIAPPTQTGEDGQLLLMQRAYVPRPTLR
jgi:hypothetical protein